MTRDEWKTTWPLLIREISENWKLEVGPPFPGLSINFAAPADRMDGTRCVLKICVPTLKFEAEIAALAVYDGRGAARLLEVDLQRRAMLLERAEPGVSIRSLPDEESTRIAAEAMSKLWRPAPDRCVFQTLAEWGESFHRHRARFGGSGPLDPALFEHGARLFIELEASQTEPVLLHGDFHHLNLLSSGDKGWVAIDPQGVIGERAYEPANWLRNPIGLGDWPDLDRVLSRRIGIFSEVLQIDPERIRGWAVAQTVLSACWYLEDDNPEWRKEVEIAEYLRKIVIASS